MTRFFRNLRHRLLSKNKVSRYLLYAVGEIVLVVIGILIALQINNWNEAKKSRVQEIQVYKEIRHELAGAILEIKDDLEDHRRNLKSNAIVRKVVLENLPFGDTLSYHLVLTNDREQLALVTSGFESLKSVGFDLLTNDSIRRAITNLYQGILPEIIEKNKLNGLLWEIDEKTMPYLEKYLVLNPDVLSQKRLRRGYQFKIKDPEAFLRDDLLAIRLQRTYQKRSRLIYEYEALTNRIQEIIRMIDHEIQLLENASI